MHRIVEVEQLAGVNHCDLDAVLLEDVFNECALARIVAAGQAIGVSYSKQVKLTSLSISQQLGEGWPGLNAGPGDAVINVPVGDLPALALGVVSQQPLLRLDGLPFPLGIGANAAVECGYHLDFGSSLFWPSPGQTGRSEI